MKLANYLRVTILVTFLGVIIWACSDVELLAIADMKSRYPDVRFKEGKSHWLIKLIDFINKEF